MHLPVFYLFSSSLFIPLNIYIRVYIYITWDYRDSSRAFAVLAQRTRVQFLRILLTTFLSFTAFLLRFLSSHPPTVSPSFPLSRSYPSLEMQQNSESATTGF